MGISSFSDFSIENVEFGTFLAHLSVEETRARRKMGGGQLLLRSAAKAASISPLCNSGRMWVITGKGGKGC